MSARVRFPRIFVPTIFIIGCLFFGTTIIARAQDEEKPKPKAWLGVTIQDVNEKIAKKNKMSDETGAYVSDVADKSPADSVGVEEGDVITEFAGRKIDDADDLIKAVEKSRLGEKQTLVLIRKGEKKTLQVVPTKLPRSRMQRFALGMSASPFRLLTSSANQGMQLMELNEQLGDYFGTPNGTGVLVEQIQKKSAAEKAGIRAGDVLLKIGKRTIDDLEDVSKAFSKFEEGDKVDIQVLRKGTNKTLSLEVEESRNSFFNYMIGRRPGQLEIPRTPHFDDEMFRSPGWNGDRFQFELKDVRPQIDGLKENLEKMRRELEIRKEVLPKTLNRIWLRSV